MEQKSTVFNEAQLYILMVMSRIKTKKELNELKEVISKHYAEKAEKAIAECEAKYGSIYKKDIKRATTISDKKTRKELQKESMDLVIKRSGLSKKTIVDIALKRFFANNLDLLTAEEKEKYKSVIL